ncbi:MAG TPA: condensation domain-containing protein, partial [Ktedonobacteraceae bacterium]|nr:condensation domain-containing protein [Ktedonobacteraceae bacterium]
MSKGIPDIDSLSPQEKRALLERLLAGQEETFPLSLAQQQLWLLDQLAPSSSLYTIAVAYRLQGPLHLRHFERSLQEIILRHESLRTNIVSTGHQAYQTVVPAPLINLPVIELGGVAEADRDAYIDRLVYEVVLQPFDLAGNPLIRAALLRRSQQEHIFVLAMHHIISDGWSMDVFFHELSVLYNAYLAGRPAFLKELPIQYIDYAIWQREWLQSEICANQLAYWKQQLDAAPPVQLLADHPRPTRHTFNGTRQTFSLPASLISALKQMAQSEDATLFMVLLAGFNALLSRYTGQEDIVIGTPIANRTRTEYEGLIGFFSNTLALRTRVSGEHTFRQLLQQVRDVCLAAYAHQELPFETLVEELHPERGLSYTPLVQVLFVLQNMPGGEFKPDDIVVQLFELVGTTAKFDLTLHLQEAPEGMHGYIEYSTDLFEADTIRRMAEHFRVLLENAVTDSRQQVAMLPLLTTTEYQQLVSARNEEYTAYPLELCIHQIFERQVARTPDAIALIFADQMITYATL